MIPEIRKAFNEKFNQASYNACLNDIEQAYPGSLDFRISETPVFIDKKFYDLDFALNLHIMLFLLYYKPFY